MRMSIGVGPFRFYSGGRRRRRPAARQQPARRPLGAAERNQLAAQEDYIRSRMFCGKVANHVIYESGAVSFTILGDGKQMNVGPTREAAAQKLLDLRNGDIVRLIGTRNGKGIEDIEVGHPT